MDHSDSSTQHLCEQLQMVRQGDALCDIIRHIRVVYVSQGCKGVHSNIRSQFTATRMREERVGICGVTPILRDRVNKL